MALKNGLKDLGWNRTLDVVKWPVVISAILGSIYVIELILAGNFQFGAAYGYVTGLPSEFRPIIRVLAPFLHSNHRHILSNIGFYLVLSSIALSHDEFETHITFFLVACWYTSSVVPLALGGGIGLGISGGNAAIAGREMVYRVPRLWRSANNTDRIISLEYTKEFLLLAIPGSVALVMLGQGLGIYEVADGVSVAGHFTGALFGIVLGLMQVGKMYLRD